MGLAKDLKVGTKRSHTAAENTKFVASFLRGVVDEDSYKTLMRDFYFVYSAICLLYTSPSPRDATLSRMPSSA